LVVIIATAAELDAAPLVEWVDRPLDADDDVLEDGDAALVELLLLLLPQPAMASASAIGTARTSTDSFISSSLDRGTRPARTH
jgi:hypothetical protein